MTYLVRWIGFYGETFMPFDTREAAKAYADSMVILKHVKEIRIEEMPVFNTKENREKYIRELVK